MTITKEQFLAALAMYKYKEDEYNDEKFIPQEGGSIPSGNSTSNPIGTIISYMGTTPPKEYLACDGTVYNIEDYQTLANFINTQFGSYDFFGGNGTTTFAVPDLRGEFLRGTGTNSHTSALGDGILEGSGESVGTHQGATTIYRMDGGGNSVFFHNTPDYKGNTNYDARFNSNKTGTINVSHTEQSGAIMYMTARPTNTSVLYCIKYTNAVSPKQIAEWIANTEYNAGDCIIYKDKIYKCITSNQDATFNLLKWVCLTANGEEELGHITFGYNIQSGYIPLDGSTYNRNDYIDLTNWVTENNLWAESATDYGKFGTGNSTTTFTTPNFIGKFIECDDGTNTGDYTSAGLPNIKGSIIAYAYNLGGPTGSFSSQLKNTDQLNIGSSTNTNFVQFDFDASDSNSIYSNSVNTVQPESIKLIPQIKYRKPNKSLPVNAVRRTLWEGEVGSLSNNNHNTEYIDIDDSFKNYDMLGFHITVTDSSLSLRRPLYREISTEDLSNLIVSQSNNNISLSMCWGYSNNGDYCDIATTSTNTRIQLAMRLSQVTKVVGIKYINENQYSTEEQLIGSWIDGKPLYQKTVEFTTPSENSIQEYSYLPGIPFSSIDKIISVDGWCARADGWRVPHLFTQNQTIYFAFDWHKINQKIYFYVSTNGTTGTANQPATLTFKYTKITT